MTEQYLTYAYEIIHWHTNQLLFEYAKNDLHATNEIVGQIHLSIEFERYNTVLQIEKYVFFPYFSNGLLL